MIDTPIISVIGLGYVGLPLAVALARYYRVIGFDIDPERVAAIRRGEDRTGEVEPGALVESALEVTAKPERLADATVHIVTVPTPVTATNEPDLQALFAACATVGRALRPGAVVVFESTVYPGVTEDLCGPTLERASGLKAGRDFFLGYSPERINPGDRVHTVDRITKVVAGQTPEIAHELARIYGRITSGGTFIAASIRTAEAAKAIENAQRDLNIAFINEVTMIFNRLGLSVHDVLEAAQTKWNFLPFKPGLVGGHCIGVDPYYLAHCAQAAGHEPEIILAGRRINDGMASYVAGAILAALEAPAGTAPRILVLGVTFKEDVPDLRNSKVADLIATLRSAGAEVAAHDPLADPAEAKALYGIDLEPDLDEIRGFDALVAAVPHQAYRDMAAVRLADLVRPGGLVADMKGIWRTRALPGTLRRWQL
ncbi:UDP-N-acetyl-D-galactosamine dehydrogenase [Aliidongia dinghuensis]|uniref:UDP-N-acetyl-D-galactosamine dehydrogenase n=1 Tax=Aliidongia dinghuensis TaxID=1867774 RepID=A0A8J3E4U7_9PROT|nr:nucleotide sugar dehydrogenase [Aliidongia dinghuensis]GGF27254.1 UDP-N-acetyl-D-galactosamine dehydrogenase [Aliidongia dinghuensis]